MSEQAKIIAKQGLNPCNGATCRPDLVISPYLENKIFPEEVENVNKYLKQDNTSNIRIN